MLMPPTRAQEPAPPRSGALVLATSPELRASGLLEVLLPAFEREAGIRVRCDPGDRDADIRLLPADPSAAPGSGTGGTTVFWTTIVLLGPRSDAKRSYGEFNYHSWATGRSPLGTPSVVITRSSASRLVDEIGHTRHPFLPVGPPGATRDCETRLWAGNPRRTSDSVECESLEETLKRASRDSAYVLSDLAAWLRLRSGLRLDLVLARDPELRIEYRVIVREATPGGSTAPEAAGRLQRWLASEACKDALKSFRIDGERAFLLADETYPATLRGRLDRSPPPEEDEGD